MKRNKIGASTRAMRQRTAAETVARGDSKYARKYKSGTSMYCKRNQRMATPAVNVFGVTPVTA